ncbi:hypothetical protein B0A48_09071 [Cryoendolithus antarcticus]|uniref:Uncharacterized protein n=1 Tax=Cryoendolithus antarcticus TaxID=1507870 RepID=A0A1V8T1J8_9PEZI|nr:hypothetical protein B0A48_09071 [Cryoendolithus antarcticus]
MGLFDTEADDATRELRYPKNIGALYTAGGDHDSYWRMADYQFVKETELLNLAQTRGMKHLDAVFNRLRDLPSELHSMIYDLYCSGIPEQELYAPTQPPLARACGQLRQEVLPVFYSRCTFRIYASYPLPICQLELKSALFFADIEPGHLALIMSLQICIPQEDEDYCDVGTMNFIDAEVKIAEDRATYEVRVDEELPCWLNIKSLDECTTEQERCDMVQRPLHTADDKAIFSYLFALPKELRIQIYEYYCSYFDKDILYAPARPPLTRVSRQLRREVLPVFYNRCIFNLHVAQPSTAPTCQIVAETARIFETVGPENLALIRNIQLCINFDGEVPPEQSQASLEFVEECADIRLSRNGCSYELDVDVFGHEKSQLHWDLEDERPGPYWKDFKVFKQVIEDSLRPVLNGLIGRQDNRGRLCMADLTELACALQECWKDEVEKT